MSCMKVKNKIYNHTNVVAYLEVANKIQERYEFGANIWQSSDRYRHSDFLQTVFPFKTVPWLYMLYLHCAVVVDLVILHRSSLVLATERGFLCVLGAI